MQTKVYYNPHVPHTITRPKFDPEIKSQSYFYSNQLEQTLKKLEHSSKETKHDVSELKGITQHVASQLLDFKNKTVNVLNQLILGQSQSTSNQKMQDNELNDIQKEIDGLKYLINELKTEHKSTLEEQFQTVRKDIHELKNEESLTIADLYETNDLQSLVLEDISKRQSMTETTLREELNDIKETLSKLTSKNEEQNDIQLEYQKLHEQLLNKIVEKQIDLEEEIL